MSDNIIISAIAAMARNRVIGAGNKMPWHIPEDFKHFKRTTMGKPVIMGRKTYDSLGQPLPGRANIVISRNPDAVAGDVFAVATLEDALARARSIAASDGADEVFIIGGGQIYAQAMPITDRLYMTVVDRDYDGDTIFPAFDTREWNMRTLATAAEPVPYSIHVYDRKE